MFFLLAILAMLGYSAQSIFLIRYYRETDPLLASCYRCLSLGVTMLPLLYFVPPEAFRHVSAYLPALIMASLCAAVGNLSTALSFRTLPIGIAVAFTQGTNVISITAIGLVFLSGEFIELLNSENVQYLVIGR